VARELISKTKRIASKGVQQSASTITPGRQKPMKTSERPGPKAKDDSDQSNILASPFSEEPEIMTLGERPNVPLQITRINGSGSTIHSSSFDRDRGRVTSMFRRSTTLHSRKMSSADSVSVLLVLFIQVLTLDAGHCVVDILSAQPRQQHQSHDSLRGYQCLKTKPSQRHIPLKL